MAPGLCMINLKCASRNDVSGGNVCEILIVAIGAMHGIALLTAGSEKSSLNQVHV